MKIYLVVSVPKTKSLIHIGALQGYAPDQQALS
jgi:hypothetical protein